MQTPFSILSPMWYRIVHLTKMLLTKLNDHLSNLSNIKGRAAARPFGVYCVIFLRFFSRTAKAIIAMGNMITAGCQTSTVSGLPSSGSTR